MHEPVKVTFGNATAYYRINVGTIIKIKEKTGLDFYAKDDANSPLAHPVNAVRAIQAIAEPPIDLSGVSGEELVQIYADFGKEATLFFPADKAESLGLLKTSLEKASP